jgi:hypothetical protein
MTQSELHNELAGKIVAAIVKPPLESGGQITDVLVLLETVVLGVILFALKQSRDETLDVVVDGEKVLTILADGVKHRLAEHRGTRQ